MRFLICSLLMLFVAPISFTAAADDSASAQVTTKSSESPLLPVEKKALAAQFKKSLSDEDRAQDRQDRVALKDFINSQSKQLKDWRNQEKATRRIFFDQHLSGPERRDYVQGYITRKKEFDQKQKDDLALFKITLKEKRDVMKVAQKNREVQFKAALDQDVRPARSLWTK